MRCGITQGALGTLPIRKTVKGLGSAGTATSLDYLCDPGQTLGPPPSVNETGILTS